METTNTKMKKNRQITVSALDKIFPNRKPKLYQSSGTTFRNESFHFQVACYANWFYDEVRIRVESPLKDLITVRAVECMPARSAIRKGECDEGFLFRNGNFRMYPDLLRPLFEEGECLRKFCWTAFWITVDARKPLPAGTYPIFVEISRDYGNGIAYREKSNFTLKVFDAFLPPLDIDYTCWIHYDCISAQCGAEPFTNKFYLAFANVLDSAVSHGMNTLYTPLFTPPLDTAFGKERKTAQLIDVWEKNGEYIFGFEKLERFMQFAEEHGIKKFEFSHLASQWGAEYAVRVQVSGEKEKNNIFGWNVRSDDPAYCFFLSEFLKELAEFLRKSGRENNVIFHISDEPGVNALKRYCSIAALLKEKIPFAKIADAVSAKEFATKAAIDYPYVYLDNYKSFSSETVYYCGGKCKNNTPTRLFATPSVRNRAIGFLLYLNGCKGLLHWGFNFYNCGLSYRNINPYAETDAGGALEAGDAFIVYQDGERVQESLRHEILLQGFYDLRAARLLESLIGREETVKFLLKLGFRKGFENAFSFNPRKFEKNRSRIDKKICSVLEKKKETILN